VDMLSYITVLRAMKGCALYAVQFATVRHRKVLFLILKFREIKIEKGLMDDAR
jgi:hypothetical protein